MALVAIKFEADCCQLLGAAGNDQHVHALLHQRLCAAQPQALAGAAHQSPFPRDSQIHDSPNASSTQAVLSKLQQPIWSMIRRPWHENPLPCTRRSNRLSKTVATAEQAVGQYSQRRPRVCGHRLRRAARAGAGAGAACTARRPMSSCCTSSPSTPLTTTRGPQHHALSPPHLFRGHRHARSHQAGPGGLRAHVRSPACPR